MSNFSYNQKIINAIRQYSANTLSSMSNLAVANSNIFSINYANISVILKNFILNIPEVNLNALGLDQGNLNLTFNSNVYNNYFIGNIGVLTNANTNTYTYTTLFCYTYTFDRIDASINLKGYANN
jgi:hypothetical protein